MMVVTFHIQVSATSQFEYAWCLVRSRYPSDIRKGIILLEDLFQVRHCFLVTNEQQQIFYRIVTRPTRETTSTTSPSGIQS